MVTGGLVLVIVAVVVDVEDLDAVDVNAGPHVVDRGGLDGLIHLADHIVDGHHQDADRGKSRQARARTADVRLCHGTCDGSR